MCIQEFVKQTPLTKAVMKQKNREWINKTIDLVRKDKRFLTYGWGQKHPPYAQRTTPC